MDGGGRVLRSMTALASPATGVHAVQRAAFARAPGGRSAARRKPQAGSRRVAPQAAAPRFALPRFLGTLLLLVLFLGVGAFGALRGGGYDDFIARNGSIRDVLARSLGFAITLVEVKGAG